MAEEKKAEHKEEEAGGGIDFKAFGKTIFWIIAVTLTGFFTWLIVIVNPTTALNFLKFLYFLEIFLGVVLVFLFFKFIDFTYKFQEWNDKIGAFYESKYKPDAKLEAPKDSIQDKYDKAIGHIYSNNKDEWKSGVLELDQYMREFLKAHGHKGDTIPDLLNDAKQKGVKYLDYAENVHILRNLVVKKGIHFEYPKEKVEKVASLFQIFREEYLKKL